MTGSLTYIRKTVAEHYELGDFIRLEPIERGYVNESYELEVNQHEQRRKYILRLYQRGRTSSRINFEHNLLSELESRNYPLTPRLVLTKKGRGYAETADPRENDSRQRRLSVFTYLHGEEHYSWDRPECDEPELISAGRNLYGYHQAVWGWQAPDAGRNLRIVELLPNIFAEWSGLAVKYPGTAFDRYFLQNRKELLDIAAKLIGLIRPENYNPLPHLAVHGDYHPGNLKFRHGEVVGQFDFDWANIDARCFEVALALVYFCSIWDAVNDGDLDYDNLALFLKAYQREARLSRKGLPGPLNDRELNLLPAMLQAVNLYILSWTISDYYAAKPDPDEYLRYLRHGVRMNRYFQARRGDSNPGFDLGDAVEG